LTNEESATPKVSVLMTCYNAASTIEESVCSVIAQTFTTWELVLVDDLSDDNSMELIEKLGDPRIKIKKLPTRHRRTKALNQGFRLCIGEYIAVLDADDIAHPTRFEKQVRLLDSDPSLVGVGTWYVDVDQNKVELSRTEVDGNPIRIRQRLAYENPIPHSAMMYRRVEAQKCGAYDENFDYAQDYALWLSLIDYGQFSVVPEFLTEMRKLPKSMTFGSDYSIDSVKDGYELVRRAQKLSNLTLGDRLKGMRTTGLYGLLYAWRSLRAGNVVRAIGLIITNFWAIPLAIIELLRKSLKSFKTVK
jgi:glycosyltransferase involved in cell wall biosynthesis